MSNFKEQAEIDIDKTFFRKDEFAEEVIIDGKPVPLINDEEMLNGKSEVYAMGLAQGEELILVRAKDLNRLPQPGDQLNKAGKKWYVRHALSESGVYILRIGKNTK